jgi:26S proteasome regulatory subunit T1
MFFLHLQIARCTKIISPNSNDAKYVINVKQIAKDDNNNTLHFNCFLWSFTHLSNVFLCTMQFVVGLGDKVSPTDIEEGMMVGYDILLYTFMFFFFACELF